LEVYNNLINFKGLYLTVGVLKEKFILLNKIIIEENNENKNENKDENNKKIQNIIKSLFSNIFYENIIIDNFSKLIKNFKFTKMSLNYLIDLIEIIHIICKTSDIFHKRNEKLLHLKRSLRHNNLNNEDFNNLNNNKKFKILLSSEEEEEEEEEIEEEIKENDFQIKSKMIKFNKDYNKLDDFEWTVSDWLADVVNNDFIMRYMFLLENYKKNSIHTNHHIIKMMYRIAIKGKQESFFFNLKYFNLFNKVLNADDDEIIKEIEPVINYIMNSFFKLTEKNPFAFIEILFPLKEEERQQLVHGYNLHDKLFIISDDDDNDNKDDEYEEEDDEDFEKFIKLKKKEDITIEKEEKLEEEEKGFIEEEEEKEEEVMNAWERKKLMKKKRSKWKIEEDELLDKLFEKLEEAYNILQENFKHRTLKQIKLRLRKLKLEIPSKVKKKKKNKKRKEKENKEIKEIKNKNTFSNQSLCFYLPSKTFFRAVFQIYCNLIFNFLQFALLSEYFLQMAIFSEYFFLNLFRIFCRTP